MILAAVPERRSHQCHAHCDNIGFERSILLTYPSISILQDYLLLTTASMGACLLAGVFWIELHLPPQRAWPSQSARY